MSENLKKAIVEEFSKYYRQELRELVNDADCDSMCFTENGRLKEDLFCDFIKDNFMQWFADETEKIIEEL